MGRVLFIKLGYTQDLPSMVSNEVSLTSLLRSTVLLNLFDGDEVWWVTTPPGVPLVRNARNVEHVLVYDCAVSIALSGERFDTVVNLEPGWEFCALADSIDASERFGFSLDEWGGKAVALAGAEPALAVELSPGAVHGEALPYQQVLYDVLQAKWQGEPFQLGYDAVAPEEHDLGLNVPPGVSLESGSWSHEHWARLEELVSGKYSCSCPQVGSLEGYFEWVHSCRILVTPDTFGLYLALAMGKKVVALFGPTPASCCHTYERGIKLVPKVHLSCMPCCQLECVFEKSCIETISPEQVAEAIDLASHADALRN